MQPDAVTIKPDTDENPTHSIPMLLVAAAIWTIAVSGITASLVNPVNAKSERTWPHESRLMRSLSSQTLVMRIDPQDAGARNNVNELAAIMRRGEDTIRAYVLFVKPREKANTWVKTECWRAAARIAGVTPIIDEDGAEAAQFGAEMPGDVRMFDRDGRRIFDGTAMATCSNEDEPENRTILDALNDRAATPLATSAKR